MDLQILKVTPPWEWPGNAGKTLLAVLRDRRATPSDRLLAAELAGDTVVIDEAISDALLGIVGNASEPDELRGQAAISLGPVLEEADIEMSDTGEFDDPDMVPIGEKTFRRIKQTLHKLYLDIGSSKLVRRRILEASVRAAEEWHNGAIRTAYASEDPEWKLTAVFGMKYVRGFDDQILEALESADPQIHYEAVCAAGEREVDEAWPHVAALLKSPDTAKELLLAAIEASAGIRPREAGELLVSLAHSDDEDIAEAAHEAMSMAEGISDGEDDDEFDEDEEFEDDEDDDEAEDGTH